MSSISVAKNQVFSECSAHQSSLLCSVHTAFIRIYTYAKQANFSNLKQMGNLLNEMEEIYEQHGDWIEVLPN